jgi:hypothetical protein
MRSILPLQAPLLRLLSTRPDLSEDQLVALGIKRLYSSRNISKRGKPVSAALDVVNALRGASKIVEARPREGDYLVTAVCEQVRLSVRRKGIDEAIVTAEGYHERGATTVSIRTPDGKMYGVNEFDALRRDIQSVIGTR